MKVIMTCGGTGGHIYPALAIADTIKEHHPEAEIMFIGTPKGMENRIVPANGYPIESVPASGIKRKQIWKNFKTVKDAVQGYNKAKKIIKAFGPDLVFGTGGYVCGPVVRAASSLGIRTAIHEQNAFPGVTNKMLAGKADEIFLSFEESRKYFKDGGSIHMVGNPLRKGFVLGDRQKARENLGVGPDEMVILCFGGSLGAPRINRVMLHLIDLYNGAEDVSVFFAPGKRHYDEVMKTLEEKPYKLDKNIRIYDYIENMPDYMVAADVIIGRAGALSLAEITACGKAALLIPSPYVSENHQFHNAKVLADRGAAFLFEEKDLTDEKAAEAIESLRKDRGLLEKMGENSASLAMTAAAEEIYEGIKKYLV